MSLKLGSYKSAIYLLVLFYVVPGIFTDGQCIKKTPCRCEFENGTGVDLSAVQPSFYEATSITKKGTNTFVIRTYFFHPCGDAKFKVNETLINENSCDGEPLSVSKGIEYVSRNIMAVNVIEVARRPIIGQIDLCKLMSHPTVRQIIICRKVLNMTMVDVNTTKVTFNQYEKVGWSSKTEFSNDGSAVIYSNGGSDTTIFLVCSNSDGNDLVIQQSKSQPDHYVLTFHTREACLKTFTVEHHTSLGSVLIIIMIVMILTYLLLGMGTLYFSGARGIEIIPNLSFWADLPALVRDGISYLRNGCKLPPTTAMPDHYDSI